eukprot:TRINITY_DN10498_c0_g1_i1.p2 TRINITY_DN10498_c0_g1~~TRINITY_DN10498_c0_g1_i1.p2  ORF type:complete len:101 (-),score=8.58 TRINITY_DN10498_c0_g1_i1:923-1225(-)
MSTLVTKTALFCTRHRRRAPKHDIVIPNCHQSAHSGGFVCAIGQASKTKSRQVPRHNTSYGVKASLQIAQRQDLDDLDVGLSVVQSPLGDKQGNKTSKPR